MQDKYVGDIGDFEKYFLLKNLCKVKLREGQLRLGVNWCRVEPDVNERKNDDNINTRYLQQENTTYQKADPKLYETLQKIAIPHENNKKILETIENEEVLPNGTNYFYETLSKYPGTKRIQWHRKSLEHLKDCDIIFYDPDIGLEVQSYGKLHPKVIKYVYYDEIYETLRDGKSIVIYQHTNKNKKKPNQIQDRVEELKDLSKGLTSNVKVDVVSGTRRFFLIVKHPEQASKIDQKIKELNDSGKITNGDNGYWTFWFLNRN